MGFTEKDDTRSNGGRSKRKGIGFLEEYFGLSSGSSASRHRKKRPEARYYDDHDDDIDIDNADAPEVLAERHCGRPDKDCGDCPTNCITHAGARERQRNLPTVVGASWDVDEYNMPRAVAFSMSDDSVVGVEWETDKKGIPIKVCFVLANGYKRTFRLDEPEPPRRGRHAAYPSDDTDTD